MSTDMPENTQDDEYGNRANDGVKVSAFGWTVQAHGPMVIIVVLVVCAVAAGAYFFRDHDLHSMAQFESINQHLAEQSYILAKCLSDKEECARLQIDMPDTLRAKLRPRRMDNQ